MVIWCVMGMLWWGSWGEVGWGDGQGEGAGDHASVSIVPTLTQHKAFQSRGGWGVVSLWWTLVTLSSSW